MYRADKSSLVSTRKENESRIDFLKNITSRKIRHPTFNKVISEMAHDSLMELNLALPGFSSIYLKAFPKEDSWYNELPCFYFNSKMDSDPRCTDNLSHNMPSYGKCKNKCIHVYAHCFSLGVGRRHKALNCHLLLLLDGMDPAKKPFLRNRQRGVSSHLGCVGCPQNLRLLVYLQLVKLVTQMPSHSQIQGWAA